MMEDNKLIAEFMGYDIITEAEKDKFPTVLTTKDVKYHTSWDWLIPVVNKIEMECEGVPLQLLNCNLYSEIGEVYQAVVDFIKTYNHE